MMVYFRMEYDKLWLQETIKKELGMDCSLIRITIRIFLLYLKGNEGFPLYSFLISLRYYEYWLSVSNLSLRGKLRKAFWHFVFRHNQLRHNLYIEPFTVLGGAKFVHPGYRKIPEFAKVGKDCTILPMVLFGKKRPGIDGRIVIGDNCYISTGSTILGPVVIGNNVTIGAGAVVTKDLPDNCTAVGVPAKPIN